MLKSSALAVLLGLLALGVLHADEGWYTDYAQAKAAAQAQGKPLLLDFTGSDWCGWCMKFDKEVFSTPEFKSYAQNNFILVKLDFPQQKPQPDAEKNQNKQLQNQFGVSGFPTLILLSPDEKVLFRQGGYTEGGPEPFLAKLQKVAPPLPAANPASQASDDIFTPKPNPDYK